LPLLNRRMATYRRHNENYRWWIVSESNQQDP
jgi:hypothetical protein